MPESRVFEMVSLQIQANRRFMTTTDFRPDIPLRAFINTIVIDRAVETDAFAKCVREVLLDFGYAAEMEYQFKNPAYIAGLLYCLIVVSKEIWLTSKDDQVYKKLEELRLVDLFEIKLHDASFDKHPSYELIRHLRNAVAHARFSIDGTQAFKFWDHPNGKPRVWEAWISNPNLMRFLSRIAHLVMPLRSDPTRNDLTIAALSSATKSPN
jgi:HEPN pEK499 p136